MVPFPHRQCESAHDPVDTAPGPGTAESTEPSGDPDDSIDNQYENPYDPAN